MSSILKFENIILQLAIWISSTPAKFHKDILRNFWKNEGFSKKTQNGRLRLK